MSTIANLVIKLGLKDDASRGVDTATRRMGSTLGKVGKVAAFVGGAAALGGVVKVLGDGIDEWKESTKVQAQTEAALKSTGGAANVTAGHIGNLAGQLLRKSGMDDEAIQSGENLLLTFTNIRNEAGKGNDIFDQTTKTMVDMSVALGQDTKSSAIQLGKALNDPIKGVTALQRVGVSFTAGQRDAIKAMVDSGDTMGAQKLILGELNKEFGGSAEAVGKTLPGQISILKESYNNLAGQVAGDLIPVMAGATKWLNDHWTQISAVLDAIFKGIAFTIMNVLVPGIQFIVTVGEQVVAAVRSHWTEISAAVTSSISTVKSAVTQGTTIVLAIWREFGATITTVIKNDLGAAKAVVSDVLHVIADVFKLITDLIHGRWGDAWNDIKGIVSHSLDAVKELLEAALRNLAAILAKVGSIVASPFVDAFNSVKSGAESMVNSVVSFFGGLPGKLGSLAVQAGQAFVGGMESGLSALGSMLVRAIKAPINAVISAWNSIGFDVNLPSVDTHIPGVGKVGGGHLSFHVPQIPSLAVGTNMVNADGLAFLHQGEAVVPADVAGGGFNGSGITIQGDLVVREEADAYRVAALIGRRLAVAGL